MMRNVTYVFVVAACLLLGFAGVVRFSEQIALADITCNHLDRYSEACDIGNERPCEYWGGMGADVCKMSIGWYAQDNFWKVKMRLNWNAKLSALPDVCAERWYCKWDIKGTCVKDMQTTPQTQQPYVSAQCE